jgi:hypothetical protein
MLAGFKDTATMDEGRRSSTNNDEALQCKIQSSTDANLCFDQTHPGVLKRRMTTRKYELKNDTPIDVRTICVVVLPAALSASSCAPSTVDIRLPFDSMWWTEAALVAVFVVPALIIGLWVNLLRRELRNDAETKKKLH